MPSPFPGMDPRLECPALWPDFQIGMLFAFQAELNCILPEDYAACLDRHVWAWMPDAAPQEADQPNLVTEASVETTKVVAPITITIPFIGRGSEPYLRIQDARCSRDVTAIEILGPSRKKAGYPRDRYLWKRNDYFGSRVNVIELDLLRAGARTPLGESGIIPADYLLTISDATEFPKLGLWPLSVRDSLPQVPIPLGYFEEPVTLDLKACFDRAFAAGPFVRLGVDKRPIDPPLAEPDATWARELLANRTIPT